ncbi:hypothetical protein AVENP_0878 [Arcobacter venerupis]|uniref:Uncharacterized protein n=1 Tax=Arcobacter venerupis TaxID=1054033 RepID=A0AAE7B9U8_9BACT|nr:hypothetical protein [Arcobacter venerupis]QKF66437.1 hypothetical protein AVENP_0878 [Arcobacter venerupis]RWS50785.1 hypothetical protein CKA56_00155 [Arcobacter venerupis]
MNLAFLGGITLIALLVIIMIIFLLLKDTSSKTDNSKKYNSVVEVVNLNDLTFPKKIGEMDNTSLSKACKFVFDSYKAIDYKNKSANSMDKQEWHTWQVSMLLAFLKVYPAFFIPFDKNLFHNVILNLSDSQVENEMRKIFRKYKYNTNIEKNRDELSKDIMWSGREVSMILYSIMSNKRY